MTLLARHTVLLLVPDTLAGTFGHETYRTYVDAPDHKAAVPLAQAEALAEYAAEDDGIDPEDFHVLFVARGEVEDVKDHPVPVRAAPDSALFTGTLQNWNVGQPEEEGLPDDAKRIKTYSVAHPYPTSAVRLDIETGAPGGTVDAGFWNVDVELEGGVPVVRCYRPGEGEPLNTFRFPQPDTTPCDE